jgi:hypothetical protein
MVQDSAEAVDLDGWREWQETVGLTDTDADAADVAPAIAAGALPARGEVVAEAAGDEQDQEGGHGVAAPLPASTGERIWLNYVVQHAILFCVFQRTT